MTAQRPAVAAATLPVVSLTGVTKQFQTPKGESLLTVKGIDLTVSSGEFIVIVGPSGCGKTTLLRIVQGLESATSGDIAFGDGQDDRCGYVFQKSSLLPWMNVRDNVGFGARLSRNRQWAGSASKRRKRVDELLLLTGLADFADYMPHQISGGMQQRVNLARALAINPMLLLMDEPFSALDAQTREHMQVEVESIVKRLGTTVIFITHDISEACYLADRIVVLSQRPAVVRRVVQITEAHPRSAEYQHSEELARQARDIWAFMREDAANPVTS
ncbi:MAG: ABC transporter ATP-binding protein [Micromonosporaceae bacterium]